MEYIIDKTAIRPMIDELVSRVADQAYMEDGTSLYDAIVLTEKDDGVVDGFIEDAVSAFVARNHDICKIWSANSSAGTKSILFHVPDFDTTLTGAAKDTITNYIVYYVCLELFRSRAPQVVQEYDARALTALNKSIHLLKSRKSPTEIW